MTTSVAEAIMKHYLQEVVHFTTHHGLIGILAENAVLCRDDLLESDYVSYIYYPNCEHRLKDADWTGYVNLSLTHVNKYMLDVSERWHAADDVWWTVLSFEPSLLEDDDVWFTTTNNTYPTAKRATGGEGLEALFAQRVRWGYYTASISRDSNYQPNWTTDPQAEVLYPRRLKLDRLKRISVLLEEQLDSVTALLSTIPGAPQVPVVHDPAVFKR